MSPLPSPAAASRRIVVIGTSAGGIEALRTVAGQLYRLNLEHACRMPDGRPIRYVL